MLTIGETGAIGRNALAKEAGLGEGAIRTLIKWLKRDGLITVKADGCLLTPKGKLAYNGIKDALPKKLELSNSSLTVGTSQVAVLVRGKSDRVKSGIEQRDYAIRAGALGATTYIFKNSKFRVPGSSADVENDFPSDAWSRLRNGLQPREKDVVIVCGSGARQTSHIGALSAALTVLK